MGYRGLAALTLAAWVMGGAGAARADQPVACTVKALTTCQDNYCTYLPSGKQEPLFFFDFERRTYINAGLGPAVRPMRNFDMIHKGDWQHYTFVVDMPHGSADVTFNSTAPELGPVSMTAAAVFAYPPPAAFVVIDGMDCQR